MAGKAVSWLHDYKSTLSAVPSLAASYSSQILVKRIAKAHKTVLHAAERQPNQFKSTPLTEWLLCFGKSEQSKADSTIADAHLEASVSGYRRTVRRTAPFSFAMRCANIAKNLNVDLRSLQSGMYLYRIMNGKTVKQGGKISKQ